MKKTSCFGCCKIIPIEKSVSIPEFPDQEDGLNKSYCKDGCATNFLDYYYHSSLGVEPGHRPRFPFEDEAKKNSVPVLVKTLQKLFTPLR